MFNIFLKEINHFLSSLIGYIAVGVFLLVTGLFLWVFKDTGILEYGYATLENYFYLAPYIFMFLIPAITMRSFSEEYNAGTIEILSTKPITSNQIIGGKFLAAMFLVIFALLPTLLYFYSVYKLGSPVGNIDTGATWGSYIGLLFLGAAFVAIGIFSSSITNNQIAKLDALVEQLGIDAHYQSIGRGVVDTRDLIYFISLVAIFLFFTKIMLERRKW